ncbi:MAG TPA: hypothetical protein VF510_15780 [Ktedonobacterales bacterium]
MPYDDATQREAQVAILPSKVSPNTPSDPIPPDVSSDMAPGENASPTEVENAAATDAATNSPESRVTPARRVRALGVAGGVLVLLAVLLVIADAGRGVSQPVSAVKPKPTATATLTPSPTVYPTPTPMIGFQVYVPRDRSEGFLIQYPATWIANSNYPGVEFDDDKVNPTHEVQVLLPGDATAVGVSGDPNDASVWVNYELNKLAEKWGTSFSQVSGPAPAVQINNVTWQSGQAMLSENQTHIRVQVYATVHDGKVFIINQLASNDTYYDSVSRYFMPMLRSFTFLPPGA